MHINLKNELYKEAKKLLDGGSVRIKDGDGVIHEFINTDSNKTNMRLLFTNKYPNLEIMEMYEELSCIHDKCEDCEHWDGHDCEGPPAEKTPDEITLTPLQEQFIISLKEEETYEGLHQEILVDTYLDTLEVLDIMNRMSAGGVISTLRMKKIIETVEGLKIKGGKCVYFKFTEFGKEVAKKLL